MSKWEEEFKRTHKTVGKVKKETKTFLKDKPKFRTTENILEEKAIDKEVRKAKKFKTYKVGGSRRTMKGGYI